MGSTAARLDIGATVLDGQYRLMRLLKTRDGIETFVGTRSSDRSPVVVKLIHVASVSATARLRLEHEGRVLQRLAQGPVRPLVASGFDGEFFCVVQPFHVGTPLQDLLAVPMGVSAALRVGIDIAFTLELAHEAGVLHRDVKPANVIISGEPGDERAHLIDFGFARSATLDASLYDDVVGTVRYIAPEAAGLLPDPVDERSDLYSLGVLLFEALTGRPPYPGTTVGEVLRDHLSTPAPRLRSFRPEAPRALDEVIERLLRKDPDSRYQTARAVRLDLVEISAQLEFGRTEPELTPGLHDQHVTLGEPAFVGRANELAVLRRRMEAVRFGTAGLVVIESESGGGKSRLLEEFAVEAVGRGGWILRGQGLDQAAPRPFQLLDGVVSGILEADDSTLIERLRGAVGERNAAAAAALPRLTEIMGEAEAVGPEAFGETRSVDAILALVGALGTADRPAIVLLDDCQWSDGLTVELLRRWRELTRRPQCHLLLVVAFRSDEVTDGDPLRLLGPTDSLPLPPFDNGDLRALCQSMAGRLPDVALETAVRLADGSPFMASAVLRGMVEAGALVHAGGDWTVDPHEMSSVQTSQRAALFLGRRLELLPGEALWLLTAGAVLGKEFDVSLAVDLTGLDASEVTVALVEARRRHIVWLDESRDRCSFAHDKLREALLARLSPEARRDLHQRAGDHIEALEDPSPFELAYHFDAAGDEARALHYSLEAAQISRARYALDVSETHYRIAQRAAMATNADAALLYGIAEGLADVLTLRGEYAEATDLLEQMLGMTTSAVERVTIDRKLGDLAFRSGDPTTARRHLERGLEHLGRRVPRWGATWVLALLWEALIQMLHTALPRIFVARRSLDGAADEFAAIRIYSRLAYVYWFHAGKVACGWAHLREMNLAERYPPTSELAQAYSEHAPVATMIPWYGRGLAYARRSQQIRSELGDTWGEAQSLSFIGLVLYAASRYTEAIEQSRKAIELFERTGDRWEQHTAMWSLALCQYRLGDLAQATAMARETNASATPIRDHAAAGISLSPWARASRGRVPAELIEAELAEVNGDAHTSSEVRLADAIRLIESGDVAGAAARLDEAMAVVKASGLRQEYVAPLWPWLATARRMQFEAVDPVNRRGRRVALRAAARQSRRALRMAGWYRNNLPHALRERGLVQSHRGHMRNARRCLARSIAVADAQGARYEAALSRLAEARLAMALGEPQAAKRLDAWRLAVRELEEPSGEAQLETLDTVSLADRFTALQAAGRRIAAASSPPAVYDAVREACATLLRGEACHVVLLDERERMTTESGERLSALSMTLIDSAVGVGGPVVSGIADTADPTESLVLSGMRSVLCAPIRCADSYVACFYVTHEHVDGLFGAAEIQLAEFISELAGASLEHMEGSEARFRSLAQNSSDVITIVDRDGVITYQSSAVGRVFGLGSEELVGTRLADWVSPDSRDAVLRLLDVGRVESLEGAVVHCRLRKKDSTWLDVEAAVTNMLADPSVDGLVLNIRDVTERIALEAELYRRAWHDPLTGLANRAMFADRVTHAMQVRSRSEPRLAVLFLDLDDFKSINDTMGHIVGDLLLTHLGGLLEECVRPGDTVARFGGDEFAVLLEEADVDAATVIAQRIVEVSAEPVNLAGAEVRTKVSIGVAVATEDDTVDTLLSAADSAMYAAKLNGKARYEVFASAMREREIDRSGLRNGLEWAVARGELQLQYQPVIDLASGVPSGFEALLRWQHPERGELAPAEFIEIAEQSGAIVAIGNWVLRMACHQARQWRKLFGGNLTMAVNVSVRQLQHRSLIEEIRAALEESGLEPQALILEITESATAGDTEAVIERLVELRRLGVRLAIDDFGTGYSSLSHLRRFPVDMLKIDRSFVEGMTENDEDDAIVASVINLGQSLGLKVVAEGVETAEQFHRLTELGCDYGQGYVWAFPAAPRDAKGWLGVVLNPVEPVEVRSARVLLVDDLESVRLALRGLFAGDERFEVVGEASDAQTAVDQARELSPSLIVLDVAMPGGNGLEVVPRLRAAAPESSIVLLTAMEIASLDPTLAGMVDACFDKVADLPTFVEQLGEVIGPGPHTVPSEGPPP